VRPRLQDRRGSRPGACLRRGCCGVTPAWQVVPAGGMISATSSRLPGTSGQRAH
jgi:hypothetical protein